MKNKQKQARASHLFRKRKSIWWVLLENNSDAWKLAYEVSWEGMRNRHKQKQ